MLQKTAKKLLNLQIKDINLHLSSLEKSLKDTKNFLHNSNIDNLKLNNFFSLQRDKKNNIYFKNNNRLKNKYISINHYNNFGDVNISTKNNECNDKWFVNILNTDIPPDVVEIASLGLKFSMPGNIK